jgi:Flp pilus assembly pilin Flp
LNKHFKTRLGHEKGATIIEYVAILALFVALVIGAIALVTDKVNNSFDGVVNELENPPGLS